MISWKLIPKGEKDEVCKIMSTLLCELQDRGHIATGIAFINTFTEDIKVYKLPISADEFVKKKRFREEFMENNYNVILLHTRFPTQGSEKVNVNNHPIFHKETNNVMVHNGLIRNDDELKKKYGLKTFGEVDSEVILAMLNEKKDIKLALKEISGSIALALYDKKKLYLYKNGNPIEVNMYPYKDSWIFASVEKYIDKATSHDVKHYELWEDNDKIKGYEKAINHEMKATELMIFDFEKKDIKQDIALLKEYEYNHEEDNDEWYCNRNKKKKSSFPLSGVFKEDLDACANCLYETGSCQFKDTEYGKHCKIRVVSGDILDVDDEGFVTVKNRGKMRFSVFDVNKLADVKAVKQLFGLKNAYDMDKQDETGDRPDYTG